VANLLGVDYGAKRVGVAVASDGLAVARPLITLQHDDHLVEQLKQLAEREGAAAIVLGLPRNLEGAETAQTKQVRGFARQLRQAGLTVHFQDEAGTSHDAAADVDQVAATLILQDYLDHETQN
jgi:putative Holliday junction resolvase